MKKIFFCVVFLLPILGFGQIEIDTVSFVKRGEYPILLDTSITNKLEKFKNEDDAIIYVYRLSNLAGCAVKWRVSAEGASDMIGQKEYLTIHINTKKKSHWISHKYFRINYVNFKPNKYYIYRLNGFAYMTGYMDEKAFKELETCRKTKKNRTK